MMGGAWASPAEALAANVPFVESRLRDAELFQRRANAQVGPSPRSMVSSFSDAGYLILEIPHSDYAFYIKPVLLNLLSPGFHEITRHGTQRLNLIAGCLAGRITGQPFLTAFKKFPRPTVIQALGYALAATQRRIAFLTAQPLRNNANFLVRGKFTLRLTTNIPDNLLGRIFLINRFLPLLHSPRPQ